mgnify:CR=1 FL=1
MMPAGVTRAPSHAIRRAARPLVGAPGDFDPLLALVGDAHALDRYALVDDAWALFLAGRIDLARLAATLRAVAAVETEASVWRRIAVILGGLNAVCPPDERPHLSAFVAEEVRA